MDWFMSTSTGLLLPIPPSSAYCIQRSDSISSAAARKRRMAASPLLRYPLFCARAEAPLANKPAPTAAAPPVRRPLFIKERRSTGRLVLLTGFSIIDLPVLTLSEDGSLLRRRSEVHTNRGRGCQLSGNCQINVSPAVSVCAD